MADDIPRLWPLLSPQIERALQHGQGDSVSIHAVKGQLVLGDLKMWVAYDTDEDMVLGLMIYEVLLNAKNVVVNINMIAGQDFHRWVAPMEAAIIKFRDAIPADCIEASCRPGLSKLLKKRGWKVKAIIMEAPDG